MDPGHTFIGTCRILSTVEVLSVHVKIVVYRVSLPVAVEAQDELKRSASKENSDFVIEKREPRPFEFREPLWYEPPEL